MAEIDVILKLKDALSAPIAKASGQMQRFTKETEVGFKRMNASISTWAGIFAGGYLGSQLIGWANKATMAYGEQAKAEALLTNALGHTSDALIRQSNALQETTTFADEEIVAAQALVANAIKEEAVIKRLTPVILDFAAAKGIDLRTAADLVTKSLSSTTNSLGRYGIKIEGTVGSQERLNSLIDKMSTLYNGAAQAIANTDIGRLEQMRNLIGETQELIGEKIIPAQLEWNKLILIGAQGVAWILNAMDSYAKNAEAEGTQKLIAQWQKTIETAKTKQIEWENDAQRLRSVQAARLKQDKDFAETNYETWELTNIAIANSETKVTKYKNLVATATQEILNMGGDRYKPPKNADDEYLKGGLKGGGDNKEIEKKVMTWAEIQKKSAEESEKAIEAQATAGTKAIENEIDVYIRSIEDMDAAARDMVDLDKEITALKKELSKDRIRQMEAETTAAMNAAFQQAEYGLWWAQQSMQTLDLVLQASKAHGKAMQGLRIAQIWVDSAAAGVSAASTIWRGPEDTYTKIGLTIAIEALLAAQAIAQSAIVSQQSFSTGTMYAPGGVAHVHEDETIYLPRGSQVGTRAESRSGGSFTININGPVTREAMPALNDSLRQFSRTFERATAGGYIDAKRLARYAR